MLPLVKYRKLELKSLQADVFKSRCCLHSDKTQTTEKVFSMVNEVYEKCFSSIWVKGDVSDCPALCILGEEWDLFLIEKFDMKALTNPSDTYPMYFHMCVPFSPLNNSSELVLEIKSLFRKTMGLQFREQRVSQLNQLAKVVPVKLKSF